MQVSRNDGYDHDRDYDGSKCFQGHEYDHVDAAHHNIVGVGKFDGNQYNRREYDCCKVGTHYYFNHNYHYNASHEHWYCHNDRSHLVCSWISAVPELSVMNAADGTVFFGSSSILCDF
ncbi:hypothetical protein TELCIR_10991 [Teladorsagia circumcincta]|uniref:Uncharacterized protein n=1 Tax=Teladorsagia circumcincta TaxID=45464 RepID=A0A2G9UAJ7_TELCI|nr:hypothetical protein TELCIR_10991 [Teladorsagia circumcincta]